VLPLRLIENWHTQTVDRRRRDVGEPRRSTEMCTVLVGQPTPRYSRPTMLHHLTLWVPDLERARQSWSWLLGELGYAQDRAVDTIVLFRHVSGFAIALEQSADMVPGMLYSRMRPGLNHLAFSTESDARLVTILDAAPEHGWSTMPADRHPIAGGSRVAYLEDRDGFEVELVAPVNA
jgi:catechol 2,3-dioxygenase-like lactoylglutathione lyase family enzyme